MPFDEATRGMLEAAEPAEPEQDLEQGEGEGEGLETGETEQHAEGEGAEAGEGDAGAGKTGKPDDERLLPKWIRDLKGVNAEAFATAKGLFFGKRAYEQKLPGGLKELESVQQFFEERGGRESVQKMLGELETDRKQLQTLNERMAAGNPELVTELVRDYPEGFAKLAPAVLQQWRQSDPQAYQHTVAGMVAGVLDGAGVPMFLERLNWYLEKGDTEALKQGVAQLNGFLTGFKRTASEPAPVRQAAAEPPKWQKEKEQFEQERERAYFDDYVSNVEKARTPEVERHLKTFFARDAKNTDKQELAVRTVIQQVEERVKNDADLLGKVKALLQRKDKDGAVRLAKSREAQYIQEIAPKVGRTLYGAPAAAVPAKQAATRAGQAVAVRPGNGRQQQVDRPKSRIEIMREAMAQQ